ncbi:FAS-associated death domain [Paramuricea clavata]|uniref:FAS-associated death domain n=1 Tax=Paramuricea clavata TaxID=317549 RepID=A0A6S7HQV1_PARCT|nr:FAS-associated death domain [Paramuricea clavata]
MEKFNGLLNEISRDLNPKDLEDLVHICRIEESRKPTITSGHHLFNHLRQKRSISEDNVNYLKEILNAIHRRDLVSLVERFEGLETLTTDIGRIIADVKSEPTTSTEMSPVSIKPFNQQDFVNRGVENIQRSSAVCDDGCQIQIADREGTNQIPCCVVYWPCLQMSCYKINFCYVILTVIFILAIITTALCWFADVPRVSEHLKSEESVRNSGIFVIIALILIFPIFMLIVFFARKYWKRHQNNAVNPVVYSNTRAGTLVAADVATVAENEEDPGPSVMPQTNPSCEVEISEEQTTSGSYVGQNSTIGEAVPFLSLE